MYNTINTGKYEESCVDRNEHRPLIKAMSISSMIKQYRLSKIRKLILQMKEMSIH